jgi:hypothetical protein
MNDLIDREEAKRYLHKVFESDDLGGLAQGGESDPYWNAADVLDALDDIPVARCEGCERLRDECERLNAGNIALRKQLAGCNHDWNYAQSSTGGAATCRKCGAFKAVMLP